MKTLRLLAVLLLLNTLSISTIISQITNNLPANNAVFPSWTNSVVKIWYKCGSDSSTGTGVILSKSGYILTAAHVGRGCNGQSNPEIKIGIAHSSYLPPQKNFTARLIDVITDNIENPNVYDLKLLKIDSLGLYQLTPAPFSTIVPFAGDEIVVAGFPDLPFMFLNQQKVASLSVYKTGVLSCFAEGGNNIPTRLNYGGNALPGFSGGPVFNKNGDLIGVHSTRSTANIDNLLSKPCSDMVGTQNPCYGNAIRFQVLSTGSRLVVQEVHIDYNAVKKIFDNYCWGTSIWRIPQNWITLIQE